MGLSGCEVSALVGGARDDLDARHLAREDGGVNSEGHGGHAEDSKLGEHLESEKAEVLKCRVKAAD